MAICPNGHDSASDDFCDVCGMRIAGSLSPASAGGSGGAGSLGSGSYGPPLGGPSGPGPVPGAGESCPRCGTARVGQFCEACGYKFGSAQPPWPPAPPAPPPPSGLSSSGLSPSPPSSSPWPPPSAQPQQSSQPPPWPPSGPPPSGFPPSGPPPSGFAAASTPLVPAAPSAQSGPSARSVPSGPSVPSVPTAPPTRAGAPSSYAPVTWAAVVSADRAYHESVQAASGPDAASVPFPGYYAERRFRLGGSQMRIGRRSVSRGIDPEIDLTGPPADPGISRLHAVLIATPDGGWAVLDPGSANGTLVNGTEIPTGVQVPLQDGDRINLGGWTAITVHRG
jgi:hypothetical protein